MFESFEVRAKAKNYRVIMAAGELRADNFTTFSQDFFIIDKKLLELYPSLFPIRSDFSNCLLIEANELAKSLEMIPFYVEELAKKGIKRGTRVVAIGGGITQDITAFICSVYLRGLEWVFFPTTLLAQADSCIGSKSSINVGKFKNLLGTYIPPNEIHIYQFFLKTLNHDEMRSGVGEMLKVHAIESPTSFDKISADYESLFSDPKTLGAYLLRSLQIKKKIIELDEFDSGLRNVMNYGHTFGHAIEAATQFSVPHGIAVSMGMDMSHFVGEKLNLSVTGIFKARHKVLYKNYKGYHEVPIHFPVFFEALKRDKKNTNVELVFLAPNKSAYIERFSHPISDSFKNQCEAFFQEGRSL